MDKDYPCTCGHLKWSHDISVFGPYCQGCNMGPLYKQHMHNFIPDNLKYLEQLVANNE